VAAASATHHELEDAALNLDTAAHRHPHTNYLFDRFDDACVRALRESRWFPSNARVQCMRALPATQSNNYDDVDNDGDGGNNTDGNHNHNHIDRYRRRHEIPDNPVELAKKKLQAACYGYGRNWGRLFRALDSDGGGSLDSEEFRIGAHNDNKSNSSNNNNHNNNNKLLSLFLGLLGMYIYLQTFPFCDVCCVCVRARVCVCPAPFLFFIYLFLNRHFSLCFFRVSSFFFFSCASSHAFTDTTTTTPTTTPTTTTKSTTTTTTTTTTRRRKTTTTTTTATTTTTTNKNRLFSYVLFLSGM
jgi:hypothetical protein